LTYIAILPLYSFKVASISTVVACPMVPVTPMPQPMFLIFPTGVGVGVPDEIGDGCGTGNEGVDGWTTATGGGVGSLVVVAVVGAGVVVVAISVHCVNA